MKTKVLVLTIIFFSGALVYYAEACSCQERHPQQHFCSSDFVILARVKRVRVYNDSKIYKVRVRREYKVSEKGILALKSGRLITHRDGAMCGSELQPGKLYALSGRIHSLKAYINLCNMAIEWEQLTRRQRKGLKRMYKLGCLCNVKTCMYQRCYRQKDDCNWTSECQYKEGICLRQANGSCMWTRNRALATCMREENNLRKIDDP